MKIRVVAALLLSAMAAVPGTVRAGESHEPQFRVRIETSDPVALRAQLERAGYDVVEAPPDSPVEVVVSRAELQRLKRRGLNAVVIEEGRPLQEVLQQQAALQPQILAAVPANYRDLNGIINRMREIASANPSISQVVDLTAIYNTPTTFQGRHLFALKISNNVAADEDEPAVLIVSTHHAREIGAPVIALDAAERLIAGYRSGDPRITSAVNGHAIWIAPVWNPDGYDYVFTVNNLWRKNRRIFANGVGVDQNRNYPQGWNSTVCSGSTLVSSDTYKGPSPASEAETQTMMTWSQNERFAKVIDYHSTGREVLYSYHCLSHPFTSWMLQEATAISQASGYGGATRLPSAEGEHQEWEFAQMGAYAFLIETHTQFQPPYDSALAEAAMVWPGILSVIERPISISGHVTDAVTGAALEARIELLNVTFPNGETNSSGGRYGRYHMFLPPGTYDVRFSKAGYVSVVRTVSVTSSSASVMDIRLAPPDTTPPDTTLTATPPAVTNSASASFTFAATEAGSTFQCALDGGGFAPCASPQTYSALASGNHTFQVRATDPAGNTDPTPASFTWTADTTPAVRSGGQPTGVLPAGTTQTTLALTTNEAATCRYSPSAGVPYDAMTQTFATTGGTAHSAPVSGLVDGGSYAFYVRCLDAAANANPDDFAISFTVAARVGVSLVFSDDFETDHGWTRNPNGTDTATTGLWERGDPQAVSYNGPKQLGTTVSGVNALVTGRLAGSSAGTHDIDGGVTSIRSPVIALPSTGDLTLSFSYYFAHASNSSSADFLRVRIVGGTTTTVFEQRGAATDRDAVWGTASVSLNSFAGQIISILIEAADAGSPSLVEAAIDDVTITQR